ncbi:putative proline-specific permease [Lasiosphaeria hispida]|uniref:Proline-specific permease n=1 Tax=Lasiosphaeria hispida TaxID=260671 RepID=A0AAJ0M8S5_9PEZI|nr:putative proline-specific permease [Lasiosphaeria hispida]
MSDSHELSWYPDWAPRPYGPVPSADPDLGPPDPPPPPGPVPHPEEEEHDPPPPPPPQGRERDPLMTTSRASTPAPSPQYSPSSQPASKMAHAGVGLGLLVPPGSGGGGSRTSVATSEVYTREPDIVIVVTPNPERMVERKLRGIHLFMITINATLGTGLYWRGGQILELGGPLAVLLSFLIVGLLAWAVMQCITEMLCIWPIPGAMSVYVSEFVDAELGIAVGVAYWFTYSVAFAALLATVAEEFDFWRDDKGLDAGIIYVLFPLCLVAVNSFGVEIYGWIEVVTGSLKIGMLGVIAVSLIVLHSSKSCESGLEEGGHQCSQPSEPWKIENLVAYDTDAANNWGSALMISLSIAMFAYVGVEIVAASALEAKWPERHDRTNSDMSRRSYDTLIGSSVKFSAVYIPVLAAIAYSISGVLVTLDIDRDDSSLPRLSWIDHTDTQNNLNTTSAFVLIAAKRGPKALADAFNVFLIFTALSCANTNLYVSSRMLFGLTSRLEGGSGQPMILRGLAYFGRTNRRKVPMRAMILSALAFWWVPFMQLADGPDAHSNAGRFIEVLTEMSSIAVLIVWACQCLAFIRYYHCIHRHRGILQAKKISQVRRWDKDNWKDYPYRSHGQPFLAYMALGGCLAVLFIANSAALWNGFHLVPFLSSYLFIIVFLAFWLVLKVARGAKWSFVDLSRPNQVIKKLKDLHDIRLAAT